METLVCAAGAKVAVTSAIATTDGSVEIYDYGMSSRRPTGSRTKGAFKALSHPG
jgi:hypothetical protein